jgi:hypothetical protein
MAVSRAKLEGLTAEQLAVTLRALCRLEIRPRDVKACIAFPAWMACYTAALRPRLAQVGAALGLRSWGGCCCPAMRVGAGGRAPGKATSVGGIAPTRAPPPRGRRPPRQCGAYDASRMLDCLVELGHRPDREFLAAWCAGMQVRAPGGPGGCRLGVSGRPSARHSARPLCGGPAGANALPTHPPEPPAPYPNTPTPPPTAQALLPRRRRPRARDGRPRGAALRTGAGLHAGLQPGGVPEAAAVRRQVRRRMFDRALTAGPDRALCVAGAPDGEGLNGGARALSGTPCAPPRGPRPRTHLSNPSLSPPPNQPPCTPGTSPPR